MGGMTADSGITAPVTTTPDATAPVATAPGTTADMTGPVPAPTAPGSAAPPAAPDATAVPDAPPCGDPLTRLRGGLWRQHAVLRELDPTDPAYPSAVHTVLDLTHRLLTAEDTARRDARAARRRRISLRYLLAVLCLAAVLAVAFAVPGLGSWWYRLLDGLVVAAVVLTALGMSGALSDHPSGRGRM
jgi:hypothetical protein